MGVVTDWQSILLVGTSPGPAVVKDQRTKQMDHPSQGRSQWIDLRLAEEYTGGLWAVIGQKSMSPGKAHLATNINRN